MSCPCFSLSLTHSLSLSLALSTLPLSLSLWGCRSVSRSVRPGGWVLFWGGALSLLLSLRDPLGVCGGSTGWALWPYMMGRRRASAGATHKRAAAPEGVGRDCRSDLGVCAGVRVCVRGAEAGAAKGAGPALAGRRAGRGPGCVCAGCAFGRGAVRRGRSGSGEKRPYPLSLSLRFVFSTLSCRRCALHLAPGAICASAVVVGSTLADSDSVSCTLPSPAPPSGAAQTPRHLQRHQKGLCWGACRLYPGLRGCGSSSRRRG